MPSGRLGRLEAWPPPDVLARIDSDRRLSDVRKRDLGGAVRSVCSMLGCAPETVAASLSDIERRLAQTPSALRKQSKKTAASSIGV